MQGGGQGEARQTLIMVWVEKSNGFIARNFEGRHDLPERRYIISRAEAQDPDREEPEHQNL